MSEWQKVFDAFYEVNRNYYPAQEAARISEQDADKWCGK